MVNGVDLQPIQLEKPSRDRHITDKVERLHRPHGTKAVLLLGEVAWLRPGEGHTQGLEWDNPSPAVPTPISSQSAHTPGMAIMCLGQLWGIANRISFALEKEIRHQNNFSGGPLGGKQSSGEKAWRRSRNLKQHRWIFLKG